MFFLDYFHLVFCPFPLFFFLVSLCYILSILFLSVTEVTVFPLLLLLLYPCEKGKVLYGHLFMDYYVMQYSLSNLEPQNMLQDRIHNENQMTKRRNRYKRKATTMGWKITTPVCADVDGRSLFVYMQFCYTFLMVCICIK